VTYTFQGGDCWSLFIGVKDTIEARGQKLTISTLRPGTPIISLQGAIGAQGYKLLKNKNSLSPLMRKLILAISAFF